jgi:hypothetical protein
VLPAGARTNSAPLVSTGVAQLRSWETTINSAAKSREARLITCAARCETPDEPEQTMTTESDAQPVALVELRCLPCAISRIQKNPLEFGAKPTGS